MRREKLAETRQSIDFFSHDYHELATLSEIVNKKAQEAGRLEELKAERRTTIDISRLRDEYEKLARKDRD